jgi:hypothetical protein
MERFLKRTTHSRFASPLVLSGVTVLALGGLLVAQLLPHLGYAQATTLKVTCAPSKAEVKRDEPVTWRATVRGTDTKIAYRWRGVNITTVDKPQVTTSYGSYGTKKATVIVVSNGERAEATCEVEVKADVNIPSTGGQQGGNMPQLPQLPGGGNNPLSNLLGGGQQGGNQGGLPQIVQNALGGNSGGGSPLGGGSSGNTVEPLEPQPVELVQPEKPQQSGDIMRATGDADGQGKPTNLDEAKSQCNSQTSSGVGGGEGSGLSSNTSQATGEYAVPVDTLTINAYVWELVRKDAGEPGSNGKSYDSQDNCVADAMAASLIESTGRYIQTAFGGNPAYVQNVPKALADLKNIRTEEFVQKLQDSQRGSGSKDNAVINNILANEYGKPLHEQEKPQEPSGNNPWDKLMVRLNPANSDLLRYLSAQSELETIQSNSIELQLAEYEMNDMYLSKKDPETGNVEIPGSFIKSVTTDRILIAEGRLAGIDERGEELQSKLQESLSKPPSQLLQKGQRAPNGGLLPGQTIPFNPQT